MIIKCFYKILEMQEDNLFLGRAKILNQEKYNINYSRYLLNFLIYTSLEGINSTLEDIKKIEKTEMKVSEGMIVIPDIYIYIYIEKTLFEHNEEYWEEWECPTLVVKKALEGYKRFLEMPRDKDTTYEFEIDDSDL